MTRILFFITAIPFLFANVLKAQDTAHLHINKIFYNTENKVSSLVKQTSDYKTYPRSINSNGSIRMVESWDWTSGFFPGSLWYLYENTNNAQYEIDAKNWTADIASQRFNTGTHDLGFMLYCSFGNGLRISTPSDYSQILLDAANSLMTRYDENVGCIRSWDFGSWEFPVIIDNMMNLELLFWATKYSGDSSYYKVAVNHAEKTIENHFREDNSSYHVINYNKTTGKVLSKETHQGYNNESDWARGQAWGLYGFTMCYRETKRIDFLHQAEKIAEYYINHQNMPSDLVPYWDFKAPDIPSEPRDASAAGIAASALIELSTFSENGAKYISFATNSLSTLSNPNYNTDINSSNNFILSKSTGNKPGNSEINTSINYADYYYLEALTRYRTIIGGNFEPYAIIPQKERVILENSTKIDTINVYDIDGESEVSIEILNNPGFIQLSKLNKNTYILSTKPQTYDSGTYKIKISITDDYDNKTIETISYTILKNDCPNILPNANSSINENYAEYTVDGDLNTFWESESENWIQYSFSKLVNIDTVKIAFNKGDQLHYSFIIQSSTDGDNWKNEIFETSSGSYNEYEKFGFQRSIEARYIKIIGKGNNQTTNNSYSEVRFPNCESATSITKANNDYTNSLKVYPKNNELVVTGELCKNVKQISLYNNSGALVLKSNNALGRDTINISIAHLKKGIYIYIINTPSNSITDKFIKP